MFGLFLVLVYAGWKWLGHADPYQTYLVATNFLRTWYIWTSVVIGVIYLGISLLFTISGATLGNQKIGGILGGLLGFVGGGVLSVIMLLYAVISRGTLIIGATLMRDALIMTESIPTWDIPRLIFGIGLLLVGVIMGRSSSSSSKKNS